MTTELRVPAVGESVSEGVLARWLIAEGEVVTMDQPIFELETDKISTEVPAPVGGAVSFKAAEGDTVTIDQVVALIDESASAAAPAAESALEPAPNPEPAAKTVGDSTAGTARIVAGGGEAASLSPAGKQLVADNNLDASAITPTGPKGNITKGDVLEHMKGGKALRHPQRLPLQPKRQAPRRRWPALSAAKNPAGA